ncbi:uncharacterized protein LOC129582612 isoform X1 [Paramacrobiotus metropolitanus]|uniref:uncharacterized protein LOC129582612 isoform X1 n=1 Tax=Paramacrobiotus metropolitanus TaxID=2943436 RepID=UPI0024460E43|nr:uncharacterized protein LOC129582612 isoform X1 [Paramacrobiotus metropolitanus]XP_055330134.1 uncharacterized protein LOC129582612 isoform X1 [Paramacrobiotus metropolitanus]
MSWILAQAPTFHVAHTCLAQTAQIPRSPKRISTAKANSTGIGSFAASLLEKQQQKAAKRQQENKPDQCTTDLLEPVAKFSELSNGTDSAAADGYMDEDVPEEEFIEDMDEYRLPTKPPTVAFAPKTKQPVAKPRRTAPSPASARRPVFYRVRKSHSRQHYKTDDEPHAYAAISQAPPVLQLPSVNLLEQMQQASKMEAVEALIKLSTLTAPTTTAFVRRVDPVPAARDDVEELTDKSSGASEVKGDRAVRRGRPKRSEPEVVAKREEVRVEISSSGRPVRMKRGTVTDMLRAFDRDIDEALG